LDECTVERLFEAIILERLAPLLGDNKLVTITIEPRTATTAGAVTVASRP